MADLYLVTPDPLREQRTAAAAALRRLSIALVGHEISVEALAEIESWADGRAETLHTGPTIERDPDYQARRYLDPPPNDGDILISFTDRPVSGPANPTAVNMEIRRDGLEAVGTVVFDRRFEASPNRVHGGITSAVFDDVMGYVNVIEGVAAYTRDLSVRYLAPMPLHVPVVIRARTSERTERRSVVTAEAITPDGVEAASAVARFALVPPEKFGIGVDQS